MNFREMGVVELTKRVSTDLKNDPVLNALCIRGEISNFKIWKPHAYFSLKEKDSLVNCVMFNAVYKLAKDRINEGTMVKAYGSVRVYPQRGTYQLYVEKLELEDRLGELYRRFEELKKKLQREGIFSKPKKQVPRFPKKIAVVASRTSAAFQDVLKTVKKRYPLVKIELFHSGVQGKVAVAQLVRALEMADRSDADVVLLVRGGGSIEDLWNFNEEAVVRKIFEMKKPIVTGVGHEIDTTLVDFVSDVRAPTPTGAAEMATPDLQELRYDVETFFNSVVSRFQDKLELTSSKLEKNKKRLDAHSPQRMLELKKAKLNVSFQSMSKIMEHFQQERRREMRMAFIALKRARPMRDVENFKERLKNEKRNIRRIAERVVENKTHFLRVLEGRLKALDPRAPLKKGYAMVFKGEKVVKKRDEVKKGDELRVLLGDGSVLTRVEEVLEDER